MRIERLDRRGGGKAAHAGKGRALAEPGVPTEPHPGLGPDARRGARRLRAIVAALPLEELPAGWLITIAGMLAFGVAAALLDKCSSWDLRNYHYYNAYRFWQGGENRDVLAAHIQTYLNPLPDLPFYWLNGILPGRALAFLLGALQGINFGLLYALARRVLRGGAAIALGLAAIGMIGAGSVGEIGSTFYDYLSAMGAFASLLMMLARRSEARQTGPTCFGPSHADCQSASRPGPSSPPRPTPPRLSSPISCSAAAIPAP